MSQGNLKLKRITTGAFAKTIESSDQAYILQKNNPTSPVPNKYMTKDPDTGKWLGNIFASDQFFMEHHNMLVGGETIRGPKSAWKHIAQCADSSFNLKEATKTGVNWTYLSDTNYTNENLGIALYNPDLVGNPATNYDATSSVWVFLDGVPFNFLSNQPMGLGYYDYDNGILQSSQIKTKNMYDYNYNVSAEFIETSPTDTLGNIEDVREYINARGGGRDVWMSYKVGSSLSGSISDTIISQEGIEISGSAIIPVTEYNKKDTGVHAYEMVERFKGIVLLETTGLHKSNLFSIKMVDTKLNNAISDENVREFIQFGINNVITELMKKITPANTQLFKVIWEGE
jgi:hypothetical protein